VGELLLRPLGETHQITNPLNLFLGSLYDIPSLTRNVMIVYGACEAKVLPRMCSLASDDRIGRTSNRIEQCPWLTW
jgi:hypothetical protein